MAITSFAFLGFVALLALIYYHAPDNKRWMVMLTGSLLFYLLISPLGVIVLMANALVAYFTALRAQRLNDDFAAKSGAMTKEERRAEKARLEASRAKCLVPAAFTAIASLLLFKYYNYGAWQGGLYETAIQHFNIAHQADQEYAAARVYKALLPLGISYFTLMFISYAVDVSRALVPAERNPLKVLLFGCCFLSIMQGPFSRYDQIMPQMDSPGNCSMNRIENASLRIIWGYMKKLSIADQMAIIANEAFDNCMAYSGIPLWAGLLCFAIQIYADFSGYMDIMLGCGELFGLRLPENFRQPFFARSMADFWKRWHITLGLWLQDYVFYPLQKGKRLSAWLGKGQATTTAALLLTWLLIGFWHGGALHFLFSVGLLQFLYIMAERKLSSAGNTNDTAFKRVLQGARCTLLMLFAWLFFRASSMEVGCVYIRRMFTFSTTKAQLYQFGSLLCDVSVKDICLPLTIRSLYVLLCILLLLAVDIAHEKGISLRGAFRGLPWPLQMSVLLFIAFAFIIFGSYGPQYKASNFLYMTF